MSKKKMLIMVVITCLCFAFLSTPVMAQTYTGTDGEDFILGSDSDNVYYGLGGLDYIFSGSGNDLLYGNDGDDRLYGGEGADILFGENGSDFLLGESGDDTYLFSSSTQYGYDYIWEGAWNAHENNVISLSGFSRQNIIFHQDPNSLGSLLIYFNNNACIIHLEDFLEYNYIKYIQYDGGLMDLNQILAAIEYCE